MTDSYNDWLDGIANGEKPAVETFARSAIPELPKVEINACPPSRKSVWPADEWERMQRIWRGEES